MPRLVQHNQILQISLERTVFCFQLFHVLANASRIAAFWVLDSVLVRHYVNQTSLQSMSSHLWIHFARRGVALVVFGAAGDSAVLRAAVQGANMPTVRGPGVEFASKGSTIYYDTGLDLTTCCSVLTSVRLLGARVKRT